MRFLIRLLPVLLLIACWGCASKRVILPVPEVENEPAEQDSLVFRLAPKAKLLVAQLETGEWLVKQTSAPVILLGLPELPARLQGYQGAYLDTLATQLLKGGKVILVQPRGKHDYPALPQSVDAAENMSRNSGAKWFAQSLLDGPEGRQRLILRIYRLQELRLEYSVSCSLEDN